MENEKIERTNLASIVNIWGFDIDRVVSFEMLPSGRLRVREECGKYFHLDLTPEDLDRLVTWMQSVRADMEY